MPNINNKLALTISGIKLAYVTVKLFVVALSSFIMNKEWKCRISGNGLVQYYSSRDLNRIIKFI